jgi:lipopolysaccharide export system protein LptC
VNTRTTIWIAAAVVIAVCVMYLSSSPDEVESAALPAALADSPDLHMVDADIIQYREDGSLNYHLQAAGIRRFEADAITRLQSAQLRISQESQPPWLIQAERGEIQKTRTSERREEEVVYLSDNVTMAQEYPDGRFVRVETPSIYYYPERQYAETDQNVIIDTDVGRTMAVGLQGELHKGLLNLFSTDETRVHTIVLRRQFR